MTPVFSIITPAYNRAELLRETAASILHQTFEAWEFIVVDDGSTDHTAQVMEELMAQDARIRYVYQNNAERSAARNNGARHAKGKYLCFLDSDDYFQPAYLEKLYEFLKQNEFPEALVVCAFYEWTGGAQLLPVQEPEPSTPFADWLCLWPVSPSRACVAKAAFDTVTFREDIVIVEDTVLWVTLVKNFPLLYFPERLIQYRVHEGNSVNRASKAAFSRYAGLKKFFASEDSSQITPQVKAFLLADVVFRMAEYEKAHGKNGAAFSLVIQSLRHQWKNKFLKTRLFFLCGLLPGFSFLWRKVRPVSS